jgi:tRNA modification GTPase
VLLTNLRHFQLLQEARKHLLEVRHDLAAGVENSLLVIALRDAAETIGTIDGSFDIEEVLDVIFSRFCIGK